MAETTTAPELRPIVDYLRLGESRDEDYLFGSRCTSCGATFVGKRSFCAKCSSRDSFEEVRFGRDAEVYVWSLIYQATPYVKAPYAVGIVDLPEGVSVNTNFEIEASPEHLSFGMKVRMYTEKVSEDRDGNSYVAYRYRPA